MKNYLPHPVISLIILTCLLSCKDKTAVFKNDDHRPAILKKLDGEWLAKGQVMGDDVQYSVSIHPVLNATFSEMHMIDVENPPQYEALVFIGYDTTENKIITHWLDSFGPSFSIPHGTGSIDKNIIEFTVPYSEGPFRDRLTLNETNNTWSLLIESTNDSLTWEKFAEYTFTKKSSTY
jgi:hypothetical protein